MPCDIDRSLDIAIIVLTLDVFLEGTFPHSGFQIIREQEQQKVEQPIVLIGVCLQVYDVWKIQNTVKQVLKKVVLAFTAEPGFDDEPFIATPKKAHDISRTEGVIYSLQDHLFLCKILGISYNLRKHKDAFQYVTRGCAEYVEWLGQKENPAGKGWASGAGYGASILTILKKVVATGAPASKTTMYRVRKTWADAASQIGAYTLLDNAKRSADAHPGYSVFDESGNAIYPVAAFTPYQVRVSISDLYIRSEPSKGSASRGFIAPGVYTIVEEQSGTGSTAGWGKLKSGAGWISLDYCKKI